MNEMKNIFMNTDNSDESISGENGIEESQLVNRIKPETIFSFTGAKPITGRYPLLCKLYLVVERLKAAISLLKCK